MTLRLSPIDQSESTVEWPENFSKAFGMLQNIIECIPDDHANQSMSIWTAPTSDVLVFIGCLVEWHFENDTLFEEMLDETLTVAQWVATRKITVKQFDLHFCSAALAQQNGFLGDLLRTADYLGATWLVALLANEIKNALNNSNEDQKSDISRALFVLV